MKMDEELHGVYPWMVVKMDFYSLPLSVDSVTRKPPTWSKRHTKLSVASFSGVYLLIFYSRRAAMASCPDERRFSIRAAWCASLILVLILGFEVRQYVEQSTVICVWAITGSVQLALLVVLEVLPLTTTAEAFRSSPLLV